MLRANHILSTRHGGAGRAACRIFQAQQDAGMPVSLACKDPDPKDPDQILLSHRPSTFVETNPIARRIVSKLQNIKTVRREAARAENAFFSDYRTPFRAVDFKPVSDCDLYHLHWITYLVDWETVLPALCQEKPLVWTIHDLNVILGIWHYHPELNDLPDHILRWDRSVREAKARILEKIPAERLHFVAPSNWMASELRAYTPTSRFEVSVIPCPINSSHFCPVGKRVAREALGLCPDTPIIGFIADDLNDRRKGIDLLYSALESLTEIDHFLLTVGSNPPVAGIPEHKNLHLGSLRSDALLRLFYSALDVFVIPSQQDNLPNTVLEAMACGLPCVGFDVGGIPDMILPGETGCLAAARSVEGLAAEIEWMLRHTGEARAMGESARQRALHYFNPERVAKLYGELYDRMLSKS